MRWRYLIFIPIFITLSCSTPFRHIRVPTKSFSYITREITYFAAGCTATTSKGQMICKLMNNPKFRVKLRKKFFGQGSGALVLYKGELHVLTANHICKGSAPTGTITKDGMTITYNTSTELFMTNLNGDRLRARIVKSSKKWDLCLLRSPELNGYALPISNMRDIRLGDAITVMTAAASTFHPRSSKTPGVILIFDGRYSGTDSKGNSYYTSSTIPGVSGSLVLVRKNMHVVGMIVKYRSTHKSLVGMGPSLKQIRLFLERDR